MKKIKRSSAIVIAVVLILGITTLTLGLIRVKPAQYFFDGYNYFQMYDLDSASPYASTDKSVETIEEKLDAVNFSVLAGLLEGQVKYGPRLVKDSDDEISYIDATSIARMKSTQDRYLLHFVYGEERCVTAEGKKIKYDRAYVLIQEGDGEIVDVKVIPYLFNSVYTDSDGAAASELYETPELTIKMRTTGLYVAIKDAIQEITPA